MIFPDRTDPAYHIAYLVATTAAKILLEYVKLSGGVETVEREYVLPELVMDLAFDLEAAAHAQIANEPWEHGFDWEASVARCARAILDKEYVHSITPPPADAFLVRYAPRPDTFDGQIASILVSPP